MSEFPGVSEADTYGGQEEELQVIVDPERLAARQLTIADVRVALGSQNKDTSAGNVWEGKRRWVVRTLGQFRDPEHVKQQVLAIEDGSPVYVRDVAEVQLAYKKQESISRRYGIASNGLSVRRTSGANVLEVMSGVQKVTEDLNNGLLKAFGSGAISVLRRDGIHSIGNQNCPAKHLCRRFFDDHRIVVVFAPWPANAARRAPDRRQRGRMCFRVALVFSCHLGINARCWILVWSRSLDCRTRDSG